MHPSTLEWLAVLVQGRDDEVNDKTGHPRVDLAGQLYEPALKAALARFQLR
jgi:DNA-directed RNA polymerase beta subunit